MGFSITLGCVVYSMLLQPAHINCATGSSDAQNSGQVDDFRRGSNVLAFCINSGWRERGIKTFIRTYGQS